MKDAEEKSERSALGDVFDRTVFSLDGVPDVEKTKATTVRSKSKMFELTQTFIVQTYRQKDEGDTIFVEYIGKEGSLRIILPAVVADVIARQRDALTTITRRKIGKQNAANRKAMGLQPGFMSGKKKK